MTRRWFIAAGRVILRRQKCYAVVVKECVALRTSVGEESEGVVAGDRRTAIIGQLDKTAALARAAR
jgi:hypothetical protein